ncbi:MAG TPA: protein kinase [Terriglobales bacterium]|nr:protein kinase [Terriglobales bacterium]
MTSINEGVACAQAEEPAPPDDLMTLSSGTRFGNYEILSAIGAGGMGEVYCARDCRLGRQVAIKTLSGQFAPSQEHLQRFEREARSASALNHPNIVTIFELGQVDGTYYIAMELVQGVLLRELIARGAMPLRKVMHIATQIAEALAKAHESGVVHRDLKPENLMVSQDDFVKVLDFGLAKLANSQDGITDTLTQTIPGTVMGTAGYMSPEQANGEELDFRSDQFSFGSVLYEMVTGQPPFRRATPAETMVAILRDEPAPVAALNPQAPAPLCWLLERCLAKKPGGRYASTLDLARDLAAIRDRVGDTAAKEAVTRPSNLPAQRTTFVGREAEIEAVQQLLLRPEAQLITLTGPAGIGKTRLALQVAGSVLDHFPGGVFFVPLAPVSDPGLLPATIAQTMGLRGSGGQPAVEVLKDYLQAPSRSLTLLVMDNFEHLMSAADLVAELLTVGSKLKVLVTSRAPLHIYGENEFPVPPLPLPSSTGTPSPQELAQSPAVKLFLQRATAVKPDFKLGKDNAQAVAKICARLDGLPLAIELAAARIKLLPPATLQNRLDSRLRLLTGGARDLPLRQQTLRGAIDWSYGLLDPAEQKLFRRVSVFVSGCTLESVEAVCDTKGDLGIDVLEGMASLVDKSLAQQISARAGESRFVMLETIREYGLECLAASGEEEATRRAHAAYCLVLAEGEASNVPQTAAAASLDLLESEHDNCRAALDWLIRKQNAEWGLRLAAALFGFWETRDHLTEGRERLAKILQLPGAAALNNARARALFAAGVLAGDQGDYTSSAALFEESLAIARHLNDKWGTAIALNALAVIAANRGDLTAARRLAEQNVMAWRELGDRAGVGRSLSNLANVVKSQGDYSQAQSLFQECFSIFSELHDRGGMARALNHQGDIARDQGNTVEAAKLYSESLSMFREMDDRWGIAGCLADLGALVCEQGDHPGSQSLFAKSMTIFQELGHKRGIARLLECLASSAAVQGEAERSLRLAGAAAALRRNLGVPLPPAEQARLDKRLDGARQTLADTAAASAWMEGWSMPVDRAVQEALVFPGQ